MSAQLLILLTVLPLLQANIEIRHETFPGRPNCGNGSAAQDPMIGVPDRGEGLMAHRLVPESRLCVVSETQ